MLDNNCFFGENVLECVAQLWYNCGTIDYFTHLYTLHLPTLTYSYTYNYLFLHLYLHSYTYKGWPKMNEGVLIRYNFLFKT